jgi:single-stranded DNA-binding protein
MTTTRRMTGREVYDQMIRQLEEEAAMTTIHCAKCDRWFSSSTDFHTHVVQGCK